MKYVKKLAGLMLAMVMALAMSATTFAADTHTYEIYQIFTGDYSEGILSNVKWGQNGTGTQREAVDETTLTALENVASATSDTAKLAVINTYADLTGTPYTTGAANKYEHLPNGYYLVKDQDGTQNGENQFYTLYIVQVVNGTLEFTPKGDVPEVEKKIVEGENKVDVNEASIGATVNYEITGKLPTDFADYNEYYYVFTDTLSKGLTYKNDVKVTIGGVDLTSYFFTAATDYSQTAGTTITVGIQDIKALNNLENVTVDKDSKIIVTYSATVNENAVIAGEGNKNDVQLAYSNDPNNSGEGTKLPPTPEPEEPTPTHPSGETPKDEVVTYTTELTILKTDEAKKILPGAEFTLTGNGVNVVLVTTEIFTEDTDGAYWKLKNGTYTTTAPVIADDETDNSADYDSTTTKYSKSTVVEAKETGKDETSVVGVIDAEGHVTFSGLGAGTYTITETKTPAGYNTIAPITFKLTFNAETKLFASDNEDIKVGEDNKLDTTIVNKKGSTLPSTGGMGTTVFYVVGSILLVGAAVLLIAKTRMRSTK